MKITGEVKYNNRGDAVKQNNFVPNTQKQQAQVEQAKIDFNN